MSSQSEAAADGLLNAFSLQLSLVAYAARALTPVQRACLQGAVTQLLRELDRLAAP